jgi:hypothetical protein
MKRLLAKIKPSRGFEHFLHLGLVTLLPIIVFVLVRLPGMSLAALIVILLSKWRIFAVRPRFWPAIIRANSVDIIVGVSLLAFMVHTESMLLQAGWAVLYGVWLLFIKPKTSTFMISIQAAIGQLLGLMALFLIWNGGPLYGLVLAAGGICYLVARHFFDSYDEVYARLLANVWGYFGAALMWILGHWLLYYGFIAQPTLLITTIGYGLGALYYFDHNNKLSIMLRRQFIFIMIAIIVVVLAFSDWGGKVV